MSVETEGRDIKDSYKRRVTQSVESIFDSCPLGPLGYHFYAASSGKVRASAIKAKQLMSPFASSQMPQFA